MHLETTRELLESIRRGTADRQGLYQELKAGAEALASATADQIESWLGDLLRLVQRIEPAARQQRQRVDAALGVVLSGLGRRVPQRDSEPGAARLSATSIGRMVTLYHLLGHDSTSRHHLLRALAADGQPASLRAFAAAIVADPPQQARDCDLAFVPLFQGEPPDADALFPTLWEGLGHVVLAGCVLDLANYLTRRGWVAEHPARQRAAQLAKLLADLAERLQAMAKSVADQGAEAAGAVTATHGQTVADLLAVVVALCDALALCGDPVAIEPLRLVARLPHRRLRTEAAAALARLGDSQGAELLRELAAEPVTRQRAVAYLDELHMGHLVDPAYRSPESQAAAALAAQLAENPHFGMAPHHIEVIHHDTLAWPGWDHKVDCYLLRYEYRSAQASWEGIGIAGPLLGALPVDLRDLPPHDIYALYAGWYAEPASQSERHEQQFTLADREQAQHVEARLLAQGYAEVHVVQRGQLGDQVVHAGVARRDGQPGAFVAVADRVYWFPAGPSRRPLGPREAYALLKGRWLLQNAKG
jgi:hypothetical protein